MKRLIYGWVFMFAAPGKTPTPAHTGRWQQGHGLLFALPSFCSDAS